MKRQEYTGTLEIAGDAQAYTVIKYAHNSALRAATDLLRDHARGGYWHREGVTKTETQTTVHYRHDDGREAQVTVTRPGEKGDFA